MKWIPAFAVKNPVLIHLVTLLVVAAGVLAYRALPREAFQNVSVDAVQITTLYPGAAAQEVEELITIPLEDEIADVEMIDQIHSSSQEGVSTIFVRFQTGVPDMYRRVQEIQTEVDKVTNLPEAAEKPDVLELELPFPLITVALGGGASELELKSAAEDLEAALIDIPGVEDLEIAGVRDRELWVQVDPERLEALGLTLDEVGRAIRAKNRNVRGGKLTVGEQEFIVRTMGEVDAATDLERVVIRSTPDGGQILLGEIATIQNTFEDAFTLGRVNGHRSITLTVNKSPEGDTIKIVEDVRAVVARVQPGLPVSVSIDMISDQSIFVTRRFEAMRNNAVVGFILVFAVLYLFIGFRAAAFTAISIPIAFLGTLYMMLVFGLSFNLLCMFGLVMVLGMIVDDAIIICENVYRHIEDGETPMHAAVYGTQEVMGPVAASVLTTIAAFLPLLLFSGTMGKFLSVIPKVVVFALVASLIECFFALPSHLAEYARPRPGRRSRREAAWYVRLLGGYTAVLRRAVRFRYVTVLLFVAGAAALVTWATATNRLKFKLFPQEDIDYFQVRIELPAGSPLSETERVIAQAEDIIEEATTDDELDVHYSVMGFARSEAGIGGDRGSHLGFIHVELTSVEDHRRTRTGDEIIEDLRGRFAGLVGVTNIGFIRESHGPPAGHPVLVRIRGPDYTALNDIADEVKDYLHTVDGVVDIKDDFQSGKDEVLVQVDEQRAALYGLDVAAVASVVQTAINGRVWSTWFDNGEELDVVVKYQDAYRRSLDDIHNLRIPTPAGALIPFKSVATLERVRGTSSFNRYNRERVVHVLADLEKNRSDVTASTVIGDVSSHFADSAQRWPGYTLGYGGEFEETDKSLNDLRRQFILSLLLIYVILGATFKSFVQPLIVMFTVPFAFVGVVYGLVISDEPLGMMSFIGVIALAGIVVNDSIVLVTYINKQREKGVPRLKAVIEGGQTRMRPIILTSVTTIFGLLPLAAEWFGREPLLTSMAVAIVWGLTFSTVLTLIMIPAVYMIFDDIARVLKVSRFREKKTTRPPAHPPGDLMPMGGNGDSVLHQPEAPTPQPLARE